MHILLDKQQTVCCLSTVRVDFIVGFVCFRVRSVFANYTDKPVSYNVSTNGADSAHITVSGSVRIVSMWVQTQNPLGAAVSATFNQTLSDIGKTHIRSVWPFLHGVRHSGVSDVSGMVGFEVVIMIFWLSNWIWSELLLQYN